MTSALTLESLGPIERLLLLQQECVTDQRKPTDGLAVCSVERLVGVMGVESGRLTDQAMGSPRCW